MTCLTDHTHVVASASCAACRLPLQLPGLPDASWIAVPFDADAAVCRVTGGPHLVEHARGACCGCSALLAAVQDPETGVLVWMETT